MKMTRAVVLLAVAAGAAAADDPTPYRIHGQAWTEAGRIMEASRLRYANTDDSTDVDGSSLLGSGGQVVVEADLGEKLAASFGLGARLVANSVGIYVAGGSPNYTPYAEYFSTYRGYIAQANLTYSEGGKENPWFSATFGTFSHVYNRDAHNLGAYLLRGPVYPGLLISGFQRFELDTAKATLVGARLHHRAGAFSHDLLLLNEHDLPPTFDWSLAYIAKYRPFRGLELGAGVNFNRLIPYSRKLTNFDHIVAILDTNGNPVTRTVSRPGMGDTTVPAIDTTTYSHQGTKIMAMFSLDLKTWLPIKGLGSEDLKVYGEIALLGIKNYASSYTNTSDSVKLPDHWSFYKNRTQRMPMMLGVNLPVFGYLDRLSFEVEYYDSPYRNDVANIGYPEGLVAPWRWNPLRTVSEPSPIPTVGESRRDTWKWSVLLEKTVASHVRFTGQIASDHYRPLPFSTGLIYQPGGTEAALSSPKEWYFMARMGFFF